ncbi:MAG: hypothetical protein WA857_18640, partial [Candidatus Acidiferrum sp.]
IAGEQFSQNRFLFDPGDFAHQLFDGYRLGIGDFGVVARAEKDNAEAQSTQRKRRDRGKHRPRGGIGEGRCFSGGRISLDFSASLLRDACGFTLPAAD